MQIISALEKISKTNITYYFKLFQMDVRIFVFSSGQNKRNYKKKFNFKVKNFISTNFYFSKSKLHIDDIYCNLKQFTNLFLFIEFKRKLMNRKRKILIKKNKIIFFSYKYFK